MSFLVYVAKVLRKKFKKNLFAIVFVVSFYTRVLGCLRWCARSDALAPVVALRLWWWLWCLWWSLVFLVWWSLWWSLVFLRPGCILCYFANLGKMGGARIYAHTHTRAIIFRPAIFRL